MGQAAVIAHPHHIQNSAGGAGCNPSPKIPSFFPKPPLTRDTGRFPTPGWRRQFLQNLLIQVQRLSDHQGVVPPPWSRLFVGHLQLMGSQDHGVALNVVGFVLWVEALLSKIGSNQVRIWLKAGLNGKFWVVLCVLGDVGHCGVAKGSLRNGTGMGTVGDRAWGRAPWRGRPWRGGKKLKRHHNTRLQGQSSSIWCRNHGGDDALLVKPLSALPRPPSPPQIPFQILQETCWA